MLDLLDVNEAPDTELTLKGINQHRWPTVPETREIVTLSQQPVRHDLHDQVTALEFYAAHRKLGAALDATDREREEITQKHYTLGGKLMKFPSGGYKGLRAA